MSNEAIDRIKAIKKSNHVTNEDLAAKTGISLSTLSKLLSGHRTDLRFGTVKVIAEALNTSLDYLAYGDTTDPKKLLSSQEVQLIANFRRLGEDDQARALDYVNTLVLAAMNANSSPERNERLA